MPGGLCQAKHFIGFLDPSWFQGLSCLKTGESWVSLHFSVQMLPRAARRTVWWHLGSQLCIGVLCLQADGQAGGGRGTGRCVLLHPTPGWSWGAASLEVAFTFSLEAEIICNGLQVSPDSVNT